MSYSYRLHPLVQQDMEASYSWYEDKTEGLGERFLEAVEKTIKKITLNPESFGSKKRKAFREAKVEGFPFTITYRILSSRAEIHIASIYHSRRNPRKKFRK
jgi:plasmid stabilization system protein ParE